MVTCATTHATVVRMEIAFGDQYTDEIYIELFDTATGTRTAAPITVDNFLNNYVEDSEGNRRYDGTFIHRSVPGFVIQGGGFYFDPGQGPVGIQTENPIVNEFDPSRPNVRGTIAMAKLPTGPDTATSEWFFNLADNSSNLDTQNGGFTVFGKAIGNSMRVVDSIAELPATNLSLTVGGNPSPVPYTTFNEGLVDNANLIQVSRVEVYQIPQSAILSPSEKNLLDFGDSGPGLVQKIQFPVANLGNEALSFSLRFTGPDATSFIATNDCGTVEFGDSCTETLSFSPVSACLSQAQLEITSNDPNTPVLLVSAIGNASGDNDGISDTIEAAGPNNGDANFDGISDALQDQVTSFLNKNDRYVILETDPGLHLTKVRTIDNPSPFDTPEVVGGTLAFEQGFYSFNIENVAVGGSATLIMTLPEGRTQTNYFKYGLEPDDNPAQVSQHWYLFDYDGQTGAEIQGNRIILHFVDGGRGDSDRQANGVITDPGGPAALTLSSGSAASGGGGGGCTTLITVNEKLPFPVDFALLLSGLFVLRRYSKQGLK